MTPIFMVEVKAGWVLCSFVACRVMFALLKESTCGKVCEQLREHGTPVNHGPL